MEKNKTSILTCKTLKTYVDSAQEKMGTSYPVIEMDNKLHEFPNRLWDEVIESINKMPEEVDTVLFAMGMCGGATLNVTFPRNVVIPRVDDCITLLMHTDDTARCNLKEGGHFYVMDHPMMSLKNVRDSLVDKYGEKKASRIMKIWFDSYVSLDVIDTGLYDSYSTEFQAKVEEEASIVNLPIAHVPGSNHILEKLVSGKWDEQFIKIQKGNKMNLEEFISGDEKLFTYASLTI